LKAPIASKTRDEWRLHLLALPDEFFKLEYQHQILDLLDYVLPQVFHELTAFDKIHTLDWSDSKRTLAAKHAKGEKFGMVIVHTNGEIATGTIDLAKREEHLKLEKRKLSPIEDPNTHVYLMIKSADPGKFGMVRWEEIESGAIFKK
jgi:hypothetical protein